MAVRVELPVRMMESFELRRDEYTLGPCRKKEYRLERKIREVEYGIFGEHNELFVPLAGHQSDRLQWDHRCVSPSFGDCRVPRA